MRLGGSSNGLGGTPAWQWLAVDAVPPEPWRNGGGQTRTLFTWPTPHGRGADDWRLRVSVADIARDGPFSAFPGVQRAFAVLQGAGVRLQFGQRVSTLTPSSAPAHFEGAEAPGCALIDGPTRDLNLMLRGVPGGLLMAQPEQPWTPPAGAWAACLCSGGSQLHHGSAWLDAPALGLAIPAPPAQAATAAPWQALRWSPIEPDARAWWLWAMLPALDTDLR